MSEFQDLGCDIVGISTDSIETHQRWLTTSPTDGGLGPIKFPLASDADGLVSKDYQVYIERQHLSLRGVFLVDPNGVLQYQVVHSLSIGRSTDELLRVLNALQSGGLCPGEYQIGDPPIDVLQELGPNRVFGQYKIEEEIGQGAFGTVFKGRDQLLDRAVALKVLRTKQRELAEPLLAEARAAAALNHPNVCTIYSVDNSNGAPMIVMEYIEGTPLSNRLDAGALSENEAANITKQIARGMAAAHSAGVVHGDLKPANLTMTNDGAVKIMDFGMARRFDPKAQIDQTIQLSNESTAGLSGTPAYMAPELLRGESASPASDVFALGFVIYEMVTGKSAATGNVLELLRRADNFDPSEFVTQVPERFRQVVNASLTAHPAERRITMAEIASLL